MTEPTIINGVDVSECIFVDENTIPQDCGVNCSFCYEFKNCYYKQLKRKEQECLTLINKNNRLEEKYNALEMLLGGKNAQYNQLKEECEKYKKCLKEIKNIAQNACDNCQECTTEFNLQTSCEYYEILKIINEVENER